MWKPSPPITFPIVNLVCAWALATQREDKPDRCGKRERDPEHSHGGLLISKGEAEERHSVPADTPTE